MKASEFVTENFADGKVKGKSRPGSQVSATIADQSR